MVAVSAPPLLRSCANPDSGWAKSQKYGSLLLDKGHEFIIGELLFCHTRWWIYGILPSTNKPQKQKKEIYFHNTYFKHFNHIRSRSSLRLLLTHLIYFASIFLEKYQSASVECRMWNAGSYWSLSFHGPSASFLHIREQLYQPESNQRTVSSIANSMRRSFHMISRNFALSLSVILGNQWNHHRTYEHGLWPIPI